MIPEFANVPLLLYNSEVESSWGRASLYGSVPATINTVPLFSNVAVWAVRAAMRLPVTANVPDGRLYNSALLRVAPFPTPPASSATPVFRSVAVWPARAAFRLPVGIKCPLDDVTVKVAPLLSTPLACTITLPVKVPNGTGTAILVALQLVGIPVAPLNLTVPCCVPKFVPVIVTEVPTDPKVGFELVMLGVSSTVKLTPLLACPETVTTAFPVVAAAGTVTTMLVALQ